MALTPADLANLDQLMAAGMKNADEHINVARAFIARQSDPHRALAELDRWYAGTSPVDARDALPMMVYRAAMLADELEADRVGWEQDRSELAGIKRLFGEAREQLARARAAGYAEAVARLRDDERYRNWWSPSNDQPTRNIRLHLADYLAIVGPEPAAGEVTADPT